IGAGLRYNELHATVVAAVALLESTDLASSTTPPEAFARPISGTEAATELAEAWRRALTPGERATVDKALATKTSAAKSTCVPMLPCMDCVWSFRNLVWLKGDCINAYTELLATRDRRLCAKCPSRRPSRIFNTTFMSKLLGVQKHGSERGKYDFDAVERWDLGADMLAVNDKLYIPINIDNSHWTLVVVDVGGRILRYYDSLCDSGHKGMMYLKMVRRYLADAAKHRGNDAREVMTWPLVPCVAATTPQQGNGSDCGVFVCLAIHYILVGARQSYQQTDVPLFRRRMLSDMISEELEGDQIIGEPDLELRPEATSKDIVDGKDDDDAEEENGVGGKLDDDEEADGEDDRTGKNLPLDDLSDDGANHTNANANPGPFTGTEFQETKVISRGSFRIPVRMAKDAVAVDMLPMADDQYRLIARLRADVLIAVGTNSIFQVMAWLFERESRGQTQWDANQARAKIATYMSMPAMHEAAISLYLKAHSADLSKAVKRKATATLKEAAGFLRQRDAYYNGNENALKFWDLILRAYVAGTKNTVVVTNRHSTDVEFISSTQLSGTRIAFDAVKHECETEKPGLGLLAIFDVVLVQSDDGTTYNALDWEPQKLIGDGEDDDGQSDAEE
ncbi:hypothetical protein M885DRAFT_335775, partial [Pelagophyceae sp. CCMP2097]